MLKYGHCIEAFRHPDVFCLDSEFRRLADRSSSHTIKNITACSHCNMSLPDSGICVSASCTCKYTYKEGVEVKVADLLQMVLKVGETADIPPLLANWVSKETARRAQVVGESVRKERAAAAGRRRSRRSNNSHTTQSVPSTKRVRRQRASTAC